MEQLKLFLDIPLENYVLAVLALAGWGLVVAGKYILLAFLARYGAEMVSKGWHKGKTPGRDGR